MDKIFFKKKRCYGREKITVRIAVRKIKPFFHNCENG